MKKIINLYSDTQTKPTDGMRRAIAEAEVGDEQLGEDPSVNLLCTRVADLLGYEAALFAPSGTMCNQIAVLTHCSAGDEIICDATSHVVNTEGAGAAALAGVAARTIATDDGIFTGDELLAAVRGPTRTGPRSRLVVVEQTVNFLGGRIWPLDRIRDVVSKASERGLATHLDGARLLNAVVASGIAAKTFCADAGFDSAWIALSKGLGCPVGGVLCGSRSFIEEAWRWKYRLGGAMRQAGMLAAAGVYALDHHVARLADDHRRAKELAVALSRICPGSVEPDHVETNIVIIDTSSLGVRAPDFSHACATRGLKLSVIGETRLRAVTHLDIGDDDIRSAISILTDVTSLKNIEAAPRKTGAGHLYG
jgi:threonine aldolase